MATIQVTRMSGPGSDKVRLDKLNGPMKQGMFAQALSRMVPEYIGATARPIPTAIRVQWGEDAEGKFVRLIPEFGAVSVPPEGK